MPAPPIKYSTYYPSRTDVSDKTTCFFEEDVDKRMPAFEMYPILEVEGPNKEYLPPFRGLEPKRWKEWFERVDKTLLRAAKVAYIPPEAKMSARIHERPFDPYFSKSEEGLLVVIIPGAVRLHDDDEGRHVDSALRRRLRAQFTASMKGMNMGYEFVKSYRNLTNAVDIAKMTHLAERWGISLEEEDT